jgi:pyruvate,orthophosphate dikinase
MLASTAIATEVGGRTSHAAVVAREAGIPCVVGCGPGSLARLAGRDVVLDGAAGVICSEDARIVERPSPDDPPLVEIETWAADLSPVRVVSATAGSDAGDGPDVAFVPGPCSVEAIGELVRRGVRTIRTPDPLPVLIAVHQAIAARAATGAT